MSILSVQFSSGLLFEARNLTDAEKQVAEKDYFSIVKNCHNRLEAREDTGQICDAFIGYYINQCESLDNLLSYCNIDYVDKYVNPVRNYEFSRYIQQGCIKQNHTFMDLVFCEDYIDIPGEAERRFLKTMTNKSHLIIPSATLFTNDYSSQIFGEVMNNYSYPIESTHILARFNYTNGSAIDFDNRYTQDSIIKPGHKSGFWFFFENPLPKNTRFSVTTEFQRSNVSLPEKLLLTVTYPGNGSFNHESLGTSNIIRNDSSTNISTKNTNTLLNKSFGLITNTTQVANDSAQNILSTATNATANATGELMSRADNILALASDSASNATQTAMSKTMNILSNMSSSVSDTPGTEDRFADFSEIAGNITNLGNTTATNVQVTAILYDSNGKVIDTNTDYVNIGKGILPGQSAPFSLMSILNYENSDRITGYELNVQSSEYSMLPAKQ